MQQEKPFSMEEGDACGDPRVGRVAKHTTGGEIIPWQLFDDHVPAMSLASSCPPVFALLCTEMTQVFACLPLLLPLLKWS
jgi:hypothetical protein